MKKFVTFLLVAVIAVTTLFAGHVYVDGYNRCYEAEGVGYDYSFFEFTSHMEAFKMMVQDYIDVFEALGFSDDEIADAECEFMDTILEYVPFGESPLSLMEYLGESYVYDEDLIVERYCTWFFIQYAFEEAVLNAARASGKFNEYFRLLDAKTLDTTADSKKNASTKLMESVWAEYVELEGVESTFMNNSAAESAIEKMNAAIDKFFSTTEK